MNKMSPGIQEAHQLVRGIPGKIQNKLKELFYGIQTRELRLVEDAAASLAGIDVFPGLTTVEQKIALAKIWVLVLQEALMCTTPPDFAMYVPNLAAFSRFFGGCGDVAEVYPLLQEPLRTAEHFLLTAYDESGGEGSALILDDIYVKHMQALLPAIKTEGFGQWLMGEEAGVFFAEVLSRWVHHLGWFLRRRRKEAFVVLLEVMVKILGWRPEWKATCPELFSLPAFYRQAFFLESATGESPIETFAKRIQGDLSPTGKTVLADLITSCGKGAAKVIAEARKAAEPEELTVEVALRIALEEIMGDGAISSEEERVMQSLREYLGVPAEVFQTLFQRIAQEKQARQIEDLDRDFNPEEFLYRVIKKAAEDGVITDDEKAILRKIGHALTLDQVMFNRAMERVRAERRDKPAEGSPLLRNVAECFAQEGLVGQVFKGEKAGISLARIGELFRTMKLKLEVRQPGRSEELIGRVTSVTDFFYEPHLYSQPVLAVFIDGSSVHPMRLQLLGRQLIAFFNQSVQDMAEKGLTCCDGEALTLLNRWTGSPVRLHQVFLDGGMLRFVDGIEQQHGKFTIALVHFPSLTPYCVVPMAGGMDHSGKLSLAWTLIGEGRNEEAIAALSSVRQEQPGLFNTFSFLGTAYRNMAQNRIDPEGNFTKAVACFERELELNPGAVEAMVGLGIICKQKNDWSGALSWLEKAGAASPGCIAALGTLASVKYQVDPRKGAYRGELPDYLEPLLGIMYRTHFLHPEFRKLVDGFSRECQVDVLARIRSYAGPVGEDFD
jgi:tetratricopeptide (TPR) repeat protein